MKNGSVKWKMEVGKWKSETRSGMAPIGHGNQTYSKLTSTAPFSDAVYTSHVEVSGLARQRSRFAVLNYRYNYIFE